MRQEEEYDLGFVGDRQRHIQVMGNQVRETRRSMPDIGYLQGPMCVPTRSIGCDNVNMGEEEEKGIGRRTPL